MQVISSDRLTLADIEFGTAGPEDALAIIGLYDAVYRGQYPCPELFTIEGMATYLDFAQSHTITITFSHAGEVIGCLSCQLKGRAAYVRGVMVAPEWQGRVHAKEAIIRVLLHWREVLEGQVDYFYSEARTETAKFQAIVEAVGWRPLALEPRKDAFFDRRESEVIYAWHYHPATAPHIRLTPKAAQVASAVLQQHVPSTRVFVCGAKDSFNDIPGIHCKWEPNGDGHLRISLRDGATLDALVCMASLNTEKVVIHAVDIGDYVALVTTFLAEIHELGLEYVEIYAPADAPARQKVLEDLGFSPTGFLPDWYGPGDSKLGYHVVYTLHFPSALEDCPISLTPNGAYLQEFLTLPAVDAEVLQIAPAVKRIGVSI